MRCHEGGSHLGLRVRADAIGDARVSARCSSREYERFGQKRKRETHAHDTADQSDWQVRSLPLAAHAVVGGFSHPSLVSTHAYPGRLSSTRVQRRGQPAAVLLQVLKAAVHSYCERHYRELFGRSWSAGLAHSHDTWLERSNRVERDAYAAFSALRRAALELRNFYRKHPRRGEMPLRVWGRRVEFAGAAFLDPSQYGDFLDQDGTTPWSNHGSRLHDIQDHIEPLFRLPWIFDDMGLVVWDARLRIVTLYDRQYQPDALRTRSSRKAQPTRLNSTELAWISILHGNWPGLDVSRAVPSPEAVVRAEAKHVAEARKRFTKLGQVPTRLLVK
jgi:hypothetical protein